MWIDTVVKWNAVFEHQDELVRAYDERWISVLDIERLPKIGEWVILLVNIRLNSQDLYWDKYHNKPPGPELRVTIGRLAYIDLEGFPSFGRENIYGSISNVSHWMPLPYTPIIEGYPDE